MPLGSLINAFNSFFLPLQLKRLFAKNKKINNGSLACSGRYIASAAKRWQLSQKRRGRVAREETGYSGILKKKSRNEFDVKLSTFIDNL